MTRRETETALKWNAEAEVRGPLAAVGGRVLDAQARKVIEQAFAKVRVRLSVPEGQRRDAPTRSS